MLTLRRHGLNMLMNKHQYMAIKTRAVCYPLKTKILVDSRTNGFQKGRCILFDYLISFFNAGID